MSALVGVLDGRGGVAWQQGLNDVLAKISRAVGNAHDTYSSTESTNASMWG